MCLITIPWPRHSGAQETSSFEGAVTLETAIVEAIARSEKSVVAIARGRRGDLPGKLLDPDFVPNEFATGVVIDRGGLILTNYHVLGVVEQNEYAVWSDHRPYPAVVKAADPWVDLAVLEIEAEDLAPIVMGDASKLRKGQIVIALGNPYAIARDGSVSATWGIISNIGRKAAVPLNGDSDRNTKPTIHHYGTLIQTDAKLNLGTSGGALVNLRGEMVGLTTSLAALSGYEKSAGYAIPMDETFAKIIETLKQGRRPDYGFLGVSPHALTDLERRRGLWGVRLDQVVPGTPAAAHGLRAGDVVTHVNGQPIYDHDSLIRYVSSLLAGDTARLTLRRDDSVLRRERVLNVDVQLTKKYVGDSPPAVATSGARLWRGIQVDYATAVESFYRGTAAIDEQGCVAVARVEDGSQAWQAGVRAGLFVTHVEQQRVSTPDQFYEAVETLDGPVSLRFTTTVGDASTKTVPP